LQGDASVATCIQPCLVVRGALVLSHWIAAARPIALLGYPRGHRIDPETRYCMTVHERLMSVWILSLEPERRRTDGPPPGIENLGSPGVLCNAQAACVFSCSASKRSSFFQSVKAMAAIFRANVRRAISAFMPLSSKAT